MYRFLDQGKAQAMATLEAQEAEQRRKAEEQARPLTVRGILASLGIKTEQVDRMMLAASLSAAGPRRASPPHSASSVGGSTGATTATGGTAAAAAVAPQPLGSPKGAGSGSGSGSSRLLALRGGGGALPRSDSAGMDASSALALGEGGAGAGEQEWEQLEQLFGDAGRLAKARAKDLKALHATMLALSTQGTYVRFVGPDRTHLAIDPALLSVAQSIQPNHPTQPTNHPNDTPTHQARCTPRHWRRLVGWRSPRCTC